MPKGKHPSQRSLQKHLKKELSAEKMLAIDAHLVECRRCTLVHAIMAPLLVPPPIKTDGGNTLVEARLSIGTPHRRGPWWSPPRY